MTPKFNLNCSTYRLFYNIHFTTVYNYYGKIKNKNICFFTFIAIIY